MHSFSFNPFKYSDKIGVFESVSHIHVAWETMN